MKHISSFNSYNEELIVQQIIEYIDYSINESVDVKSVWNNVVNKIKGLSQSAKRKIIKYAIGSLLVFNTVTNVIQIINSSNASPEDKQLAIEMCEEKEEKYKAGYDFVLSQDGWDHIKNEEKCKLTAYKIGDGMITVGYGHAEKSGKTKLRVGQKITQEKADEYLKEDLKEAADGVRRMFKDWEEEGTNVTITQSMFDALVSMAFNAGVGGLRRSEVVEHLKKGDYQTAADSIKTFRVSSKFPGLAIRRAKESEMFLASI
jgi:GH24 family phage-related lysozyme (muramidase)